MTKLLLAGSLAAVLSACAYGTYGNADRTGGAMTPTVGAQGGGGPRGATGGGPN